MQGLFFLAILVQKALWHWNIVKTVRHIHRGSCLIKCTMLVASITLCASLRLRSNLPSSLICFSSIFWMRIPEAGHRHGFFHVSMGKRGNRFLQWHNTEMVSKFLFYGIVIWIILLASVIYMNKLIVFHKIYNRTTFDCYQKQCRGSITFSEHQHLMNRKYMFTPRESQPHFWHIKLTTFLQLESSITLFLF